MSHYSVTTYSAAGKQINPTITKGVHLPYGVAVNATGTRLYVANQNNATVTTYNSMGVKVAPNIKVSGPGSGPLGIAVDASGKIYVTVSGGDVRTYTSHGQPTSPTLTNGVSAPFGIAIAPNGKVYVVNSGLSNGGHGSVTTYNANGKRTPPTITAGLSYPTAVTVDSKGKIYVANDGGSNVTTYTSKGMQTAPTIVGLDAPYGVAVDASGNIFVSSSVGNSVTEYSASGTQIATITGLFKPLGIAVH